MTTPGYVFEPMSEEAARAVAGWRHDPPYDFYDAASDPNDLEELLDSERRGGYCSALSDGDGAVVGFFCFGEEARVPSGDYADARAIDVGLGLRPDLTGRGLGLAFLMAGLEFARRRFAPARYRLSVATFNERAIRLCERAGFEPVEVFEQRTNGGGHPFLLMTREA